MKDAALLYRDTTRWFKKKKPKKQVFSISIVDCIKFCGAHELALRGSDESLTSLHRGVYLDLVDQISFLDSQLADHLSSTQVSKYTSKTCQNELLDCM